MKNMEICKHDQVCGGCIYQGMTYEEQLKTKEAEVLRLLAEKGVAPRHIEPIEGCPAQYGYRNKMEYTFGDMVKDGEMTLGMHKKGNFMSIITVDQCQLVDPDFNLILRSVLDFAVHKDYSFYHKRSHQGLLRNLIIRKGMRTGELLVNIVTASDDGSNKGSNDGSNEGYNGSFDEEAFASMIRGLETDNKVVGILRTTNDSLADAVVSEQVKTLWGRDYYMEEIMGLKFKVSAFSFFQTNVEAAERLYTQALSLLDDIEGKAVFDLYCGTGTISQIMALKAKSVLGVELVPEAVMAAEENARINGLDNCKFFAGDTMKVLTQLEEKPDVIVVDPPRVGIQPKALDRILEYGASQILYISCNPKTLADNLKYMEFYGYQCEYLKPFDNFAFTKHVESVVLMSRVQK